MNTDRFSEPELLALLPALRRLTAALGLDADTADDVVQRGWPGCSLPGRG